MIAILISTPPVWIHPRGLWGLRCTIFSFLCSVLSNIVLSFLSFFVWILFYLSIFQLPLWYLQFCFCMSFSDDKITHFVVLNSPITSYNITSLTIMPFYISKSSTIKKKTPCQRQIFEVVVTA